MELTHEFTVPASVAETWQALNDVESMAGCFPGATVTGVEGDSFEGTCKVKLGPIALLYRGAGTFAEKDEAAGVLRLEAKGKDKRGNGTAGANVVATLTDAGSGSTKVEVVTDLSVTGKPAQFGRGVMQDVSDKLLAQFTDCLAQKLSGPAALAGEDQDSGPASAPVGAAAEPLSSADQDSGPASAPGAAATAPPPTSTLPPVRSAPAAEADDDALDLGAAVLPVLLKSYGKQLLAGAAGLFVLVWLVRRIRR